MKKTDLREVLALVKDKMKRDADSGCGIFWNDVPATTKYAVGEEDASTEYSVGEEDAHMLYGIIEEPE